MRLAGGAAHLMLAAATAGATAVGMGAFATHALRASLSPQRLAVLHTAVLYHLVHAVALLVVAVHMSAAPRPTTALAGSLWVLGILLFCGSLYALVLADMPRLGVITPFGGLALIAGWAALGIGALRH